MDPDAVRAWQRVIRGIVRDSLIVAVGTFILVYETVAVPEANWELIAAALTCFGLPPALRLDLRRRGDEDDENGKVPTGERRPEWEDRWSHLE